ncbi:peptidoglycan-binding protein LysM [Spirochaetia bacterium]|nr:peptidoglycan-binding protein LysM [Spirochaetia bacterium]GHV49368.1 peptidoglycan-binding protein LysM [Spirochaetia bacterium]
MVEKGDTIYSIARSFRVAPEELMQFNGIVDASKLQVGRQLRIPGASAGSVTSVSAAPAVTYTEHRVVKNETLYSIARNNGITLAALRSANNFSQDHVLREGERIRIPTAGIGGANGTSTTTAVGTAPPQTAPTTTAPAGQPQAVPARPAAVPVPEPRSTAAKTMDSSLRWPVAAKEVAYMTGKLSGVVVTGERSESVKSLTQGTVVSAGPYRGFGRVAIIQVTGGYLYVYGGCESLTVKEGDRVGPGTELGKLGIDAVSQKPQLFFMVYRNNTPMDPSKAPRA